MLFRLRMTVDEAIVAYTRLAEDVFSKKIVLSHKKSNASRLENAVAKIVLSSIKVENNLSQNIRMLDDKGPKWRVVHLSFEASIDLFLQFHHCFNCKKYIFSNTLSHICTPSSRQLQLHYRGSNQSNDS